MGDRADIRVADEPVGPRRPARRPEPDHAGAMASIMRAVDGSVSTT